MINKEYMRIEDTYFGEGKFIPMNVYVKIEEKFVLLCSKTIITKSLYNRIRVYVIQGIQLYVLREDYINIVGKAEVDEKCKMIESIQLAYEDVREELKDTLGYIEKTGKVSLEHTNNMVDRIFEQMTTIKEDIILQCVHTIKTVDEYLFTHCVNVSIINGLMGKWLNLSENDIFNLVRVGLLHDIGKMAIPDNILNKKGPLTDEEFEVMKLHAQYSFALLVKSGIKEATLLLGVRQHHERVNGSGYPDGLRQNEISLFARITAISDIYDAMVAKRVYKYPVSPFEVLEQFAKERFSNLDISLVNVFLKNMPKELLGKDVVLSNGTVGKVVYINPSTYKYPIVQVGQSVFQTDESVKCVTLA